MNSSVEYEGKLSKAFTDVYGDLSSVLNSSRSFIDKLWLMLSNPCIKKFNVKPTDKLEIVIDKTKDEFKLVYDEREMSVPIEKYLFSKEKFIIVYSDMIDYIVHHTHWFNFT